MLSVFYVCVGRFFYKTLNCDSETAQLVVQACVVLHNFLMLQSSSTTKPYNAVACWLHDGVIHSTVT